MLDILLSNLPLCPRRLRRCPLVPSAILLTCRPCTLPPPKGNIRLYNTTIRVSVLQHLHRLLSIRRVEGGRLRSPAGVCACSENFDALLAFLIHLLLCYRRGIEPCVTKPLHP